MKTKASAVILTFFLFLSLSFTLLAEAVEIGYDDGSAEIGLSIGSAYKVGVMFTQNNLPYSHNLLNSVNIYAAVNNPDQQLKIYFLDSSFNEIHPPIFTPPLALGIGWKYIDVSSYGITLEQSFLIGIQWVSTYGVYLGYDKTNPANNGHSYDYNTTKWPEPYWGSPPDPSGGLGDYGNWMIRADLAPAPPVADAGPDQSVVVIGDTVQLDGSQSYDPDGNPITYQWSWVSWPGSTNDPPTTPPTLTGETTVNPTFVAGVHGDYSLQLVVNDGQADSAPDCVTVSFNNVKPVANAGSYAAKVYTDPLLLDGSGSTDANGDQLTYQWSLVSAPEGSTATLNALTPKATFIADLPGTYVISLVVNDGYLSSDPNNTTVTFLTKQDAASENLTGTVEVVASFTPAQAAEVFVNTNMQNALTNKINEALKLIDQKKYSQALNKLQNDILPKTNGCHDSGAPDANDWIKDCATQQQVYPFVVQTIELLQGLQ